MDSLLSTVQDIFLPRPGWQSTCHFDDIQIHTGFETRAHAEAYVWDGMKRGADEDHPFVVFQYTLDGWGCFEDAEGVHPAEPGSAFSAIVPSEQVYFLPETSRSWTFFWMVVQHRYVVDRIKSLKDFADPLISITAEDALMTRFLHVIEGVRRNIFRDRWALEQALFEFLFEYERHSYRQRYPSSRRETLLTEVRAYVLEHSGRPIEVEELAEKFDISRSHFSRRFKEQTGIAPAEYIRRVRFDEAARRLVETNDKLETIAIANGFANANHFCKAFRGRFHLSPGAFRRLTR